MPGTPAWTLVWPRWQRGLHTLLALGVIVALVTHEGGGVHEWAGYVALAAAVARVTVGFAGPVPARFASFVRSLGPTWCYARALWRHQEAHHLNHNPLGAWMVLALLGFSVFAGATGALYVTDRYWGEAGVIALHALLAWPLAVLLPLHLTGVVHASRRQRENLAAAMWWHGRKRADPG